MNKRYIKKFFSALNPSLESSEESPHTFFPSKKNQAIALVALAVFIVSCAIYGFLYQNTFYPGVKIDNMSVGGKTYEEVMSHFGDKAKVLNDTGLQFKFIDGGTTKELRIPVSATGFHSDKSFEYFSLGDWEKTIQDAYEYGRTGSLWQQSKEHARLLFGKKFPLPTTLYEVAVDSFLSRELELFLKKTEPARFAIDKNGKVYITPEKNGESMDVKNIITVLKKKLSSFDSSSENFKAETEVPLSTTEKLKPFLTLAQELSQHNTLVFHYKKYTWNVRGTKLVTWLTIKENGELGIDKEKLESFLHETVAQVIDDLPQNSRFKMQDGVLEEIIPGQAGNVVDVASTAEKVEQVIQNTQRSFATSKDLPSALSAADGGMTFNATTGTINIPVDTIHQEPRITKLAIDQLDITALVGSSKTSFKGSSADRIKNITVGASKLNGLLIAPGEEFSAVNAIGYVTEADGYVKEFVIKDNKSVKELGGGLCQIATTLFRLALNTGLTITERTSHRYVVGYYGPGLDATIYGPHPDLRFVNNTEHYLLLQSRVVGTDLMFEFYGQKDGRQVSISEPVLSNHIPAPATKYIPTTSLPPYVERCSETPRDGVTADVTYRVTLPNGEVHEQIFNSVYQPWQRKCLTGIKK